MMPDNYLYVALLDVLAYRYHLEKDRSSGKLKFHEKLSNALNILDSVNEAVFKVRAISDTIIISSSEHKDFPKFLDILRKVFIAFLEQGLLIRGGVAYSRHFESARLTYSHALTRAYELESKCAVYPRILIDGNIVDMYENGRGLPCIVSKGLLCKENGIYFLNILTKENWQTVYNRAKQIYEDSASPSLDECDLIKHQRLERYILSSSYAREGVGPYISRIEEI